MNRITTALAASFFIASAAYAQPPRNRQERAQDRQEVRQDQRAIRDDRKDLAELQAVLSRFDNAWAQRNEREMSAVESRLRELLRQELAEGKKEMAQSQAEVRRDNREVHGDRRELGRDEMWGKPVAFANDRRDLRDDRRDRRDDVQDARAEAASHRTRSAIAWELSPLMGSRRPADLQRMRSLIVDLIGLAQQEIQQDHSELREDHRENREDRRETREDRRQRF
ncbi:hypothetical protein [Hyalangium versicolor]|uniref:hypothetical protein n=1 Tax=Hyalangium versicolor TaxID=2861190 RepID=UPI001CCCEFF8|nr:hypothetical protein [Hyalangium versicolor]